MLIKLKQTIKDCFIFLYKHIFTILCIVLFFVISSKFEYFYFQKKEFLFSSLSLVFVMHLFSRLRYNIIFTILFSLIVTINFYSAFILNTYFNSGLFGSIMDTNMGEAESMSKEILKWGIPMFLLSFTLIYMSMKELSKSKIPLKISAIGALASFLLIVPINAKRFLTFKFGGMTTEVSEYPLVIAELATQRTAPILYGNLLTMANYVDERMKYKNFYNTENKILPEGIKYTRNISNDSLPKKIYLIIGESATRKRMSLYGYHHPTTPYADSLALHDNNFRAYKGYSSSTITRDAFRQILTACTPHDMEIFFKTQSLVDMANDTGMKSIWISPMTGIFRQHSGTYLQLLSSSAQELKYSPKRDDIESINLLNELPDENESRFILIGLNGSHGGYADGLDEIDQAALPSDNSLSKDDNNYNRTIHHTDRFLRAMHQVVLRDSSSVMLYASDHGEIIGKGHGMREGRAQIEIPMLAFNNSKVDLDKIIDKYTYQTKRDSSKALNNQSLFYIVAELMGYTVSEEAIKQTLHESRYVYYADKTIGLAADMQDGENINKD